MLRRPAVTRSRRRPLCLELLEGRTVPHCAAADPFLCTPLAPSHDGLALHFHPHLKIVADGQDQVIPANVGITLNANGQPTAFLPIHTHDATGTLHVESPTVRDFHLSDFFAIWDQPLSATQVLGFHGTVTMTVNGQPSTELGNLLLRDGQQIEIRVTTAAPSKPGTIQFGTPSYTVAANAGSVTFLVSRTDGTDGTVHVNYATADGTGRAGVDYVAANGELVFADGETSKTFTVSILNSNPDGNRTVSLTLSNPTGGATLGSPASVTLTITPPVDPEANRAYVAQVYRDFYKREADATGLNTWAGALNNGVSRTDVLVGLAGTQECYTKMVTAAYQKLLGRAPDQAGLNGFTAFLTAGGTVEQVQAAICGSDEYYQKSGGNNGGYLETLYKTVLGRDIDAAGRAGFTRALSEGHTRGKVAEAVFGSVEYREKLARGLYQEYLGRIPDPGGLSYWTEAIRVGTREQHVRVGFLTSAEYVNRVGRRS